MTLLLFTASTLLSFLAPQSTIIGSWLIKRRNSPSDEDKALLQEKQELKYEQSKYSMMDDFAKYSKIQRKINAIDEKLKESIATRNNIQSNLILQYGPVAVCTLILLVLSLYYRRTPLFRLPESLDLTPFNFIISFPNERNCVSFHFWVMSCNVVARSVKF